MPLERVVSAIRQFPTRKVPVLNFFTPIVPRDKYHPNFRAVLEFNNAHDQALFAEWAEGFQDRDGKIVHEFQTTFNSVFWEVYLNAVLKEIGCTVDFKHQRPDFVVTAPTRFTMEATVASNAQGTLPEHNPIFDSPFPWDLNEFNRSAVIRLMNSISEKSRKYLNSYNRLAHVQNAPYVIAVAPFDQPFAYLQVHRAIDAALFGYYVDEQEYLDDPSFLRPMPAYRVGAVFKNPTTQIPVGLFNDPANAHISAVVFSSCAMWGKVRCLSRDPNPRIHIHAVRFNPSNGHIALFNCTKRSGRYKESLLDGLRVYHNPHATYPLDRSIFRRSEVFQGTMNQESGEWEFEIGSRSPLACRRTETIRLVGGKRPVAACEHEDDRKERRKQKQKERERKQRNRK